MAQVSITQLPQALALTGTESVPIVQNGVTVETTTGAISGAGALNYPFLTVGSTVGLTQARYLSVGSGLSLSDGGAGGTLQISMTGTASSLNGIGTGIVVKTGSNTVAPRSLAVGAGLTIADADGVSGNPTVSLGTFLSGLTSLTGTGILAIQSGNAAKINILGTANQLNVANGNGSSDVTLSIASNPILPGTGSVTIPSGTTAQQPIGTPGQFRFNSDTQTFDGYANGSWNSFAVTGAVTSFSAGSTGFSPSSPTTGVVVLSGILNPTSGGTGVNNGSYTITLGGNINTAGAFTTSGAFALTLTATGSTNVTLPTTGTLATLAGVETLTNKSMSGLSNTFTNIPNSALTNSAITIGSTSVSLGGTITTFTGTSISGSTNTLTNIPNSALTNSSVTYNGVTVNLGASGTITASTTFPLTVGTGLQFDSGTTFDGSAGKTISIDSTVVTLSGTQTLTNKTLTTPVIAQISNTGVLTLPTSTDTLVGRATTDTLTNKSISGSTNTLSNIPNSALTNSSVTIGTTSIALGASSLTLGGLTSVAVTQDPTSALQLATKQYVDAVAEGLHVHASCAAATPNTLASLTGGTVTYNNGTAGVGATLTLSVALTTLDGYTLQNGNRILVKNEATQANNGIYTWATGGTVLTRATDFDTPTEVASGDFTFVSNGTLYANTGWVQITDVTTIGTDPIVWQQFSGAGTYTAGTGLTLTGSQFSITNTGVSAATYGSASAVPVFAVNAQGQLTSVTNTSISINGNQITSGTVGSSYISGSYTGITGVGTLTAGTWNATTIGVAYGGTGLASYTTGDLLYATGSTTLAKLGIGTSNQILTSSGTAPQWTSGSSVSVGTATNLAGGTTGSVPYQTGAGATTFLGLGTSGQVLTAGTSAPQYVAQSTLSVGSATNATNATNTGITANSTNATNYLTFVSSTSGNLPQLVNSFLTCNPGTGQITGGISGGSF